MSWTLGWREWLSCQPTTTLSWVGSGGRGGCRFPADPNNTFASATQDEEVVLLALLTCGTAQAADRYRQAKRCATVAVAEAKTRVWEGFGEAMENDFQTALKRFWTTIRCLTRLCKVAWTSGAVLLDWPTGVVVPLLQKGNRAVCSNYRGITLLSLPGKVFSGVLGRWVRG